MITQATDLQDAKDLTIFGRCEPCHNWAYSSPSASEAIAAIFSAFTSIVTPA
jgi:hypothetical protein